MNDNLKGLLAFAISCAYVVGAIGSIGYAFHARAWFIGVCAVIVAVMALPTVIRALKDAGFIGK